MRNPLICNMVEVLSIQDQDKCIPCRSSDEIDKIAEVKDIVEDKGIINFSTFFLHNSIGIVMVPLFDSQHI